jgi:hypothetical protein
MINFKSVDGKSRTDIDTKLNCTQVRVGDAISISIPKSLTKCKPKIAIVKCNQKLHSCEPDLEPDTLLGCVYSIDNDEKAYVNLVIKNRDLIPNFKIGRGETIDGEVEISELFEYEEGGNYDTLIEYLISNPYVGFEETSYGVKIFFDKENAGHTIKLESDNTLFLIGKTFCLNKSSEYGLSFCLPKGCWQILLYTGEDEVLAYSNAINSVDFEPVGTSIIEWYEDGLYHRERLPIWTEDSEILIEENETVLSSGKISITDTIIRPEKIFYTENMEIEQHRKLVKIFKGSFRINNEKALLRGDYTLIPSNRRYMASGRLNFPDDDIIGLQDCTTGCASGSTLEYKII